MQAALFAVILVFGISVGNIAFSASKNSGNEGSSPAPVYPKNESGQTYGSGLESTSPDTDPDLIKAYGVDGTLGYVQSADLIEEMPKSPEEALKIQAKGIQDKEIPLYDVSGKKVIGKFKIKASKGTEIKENDTK
jgi:hypothetical protein